MDKLSTQQPGVFLWSDRVTHVPDDRSSKYIRSASKDNSLVASVFKDESLHC